MQKKKKIKLHFPWLGIPGKNKTPLSVAWHTMNSLETPWWVIHTFYSSLEKFLFKHNGYFKNTEKT